MASIISNIIPEQAFEAVHNRIGEILTVELDMQSQLAYDPDLELSIYKERDIPYSSGELPAINVMMERSTYEAQTITQNDAVYRYVIECQAEAKSLDGELGDARAMTKVQKVLGKCRGILEHPLYKTLGFTPPFIMNRHVEEMFFGKPVRQDSSHVALGRLMFLVKVSEMSQAITPNPIAGSDTSVKLDLTDKGYLWILQP